MLRILRKAAASMEKSGGSSPAERYDVVDDDLSTWEFVDASQSEDEDLYSFDGDDVISDGDGDGFLGEEPESKLVDEEEDGDTSEPRGFRTPDGIISIRSLSVSPPMTFPVEVAFNYVCHDDEDGYGDADDDDDDVCDVDDFDDELVPWKLKDRFGKQRIRKLGKRGGPKLNKSKRLAYCYNRPGCLYGKHGFGVQHSFI